MPSERACESSIVVKEILRLKGAVGAIITDNLLFVDKSSLAGGIVDFGIADNCLILLNVIRILAVAV